MSKMWTIDAIMALTEMLKEHYDDYKQEKTQDLSRVFENCKHAAEVIIQLKEEADMAREKNSSIIKQFEAANWNIRNAELKAEKFAAQVEEHKRENEVLKAQMEVVRMFLGKDGNNG